MLTPHPTDLIAPKISVFVYASPGIWMPDCCTNMPTMASMQIRPCLISAQRAYRRSVWISERRMGSNPISPGTDPSSLSGRTKKGMDFENSSAFRETEPVRCAVYITGAINHRIQPRSGPTYTRPNCDMAAKIVHIGKTVIDM